ncbi:MAG: ABC transporter substrate-binding protein, partial [Halanaerobiaceae bacterium]
MNYKKRSLLVVFILLFTFFCVFKVSAQYDEYIDPEIPEEWYEDLKTASEMDITEFNQSPILDSKVEEGELPPVEERLPDDPPVIVPYDKVGNYGGTANVWGTTLDYGGDVRYLEMPPSAGQVTPTGGKTLPMYVKDWEYSDDATKLTIYLREGMKWSNGELFTADDYMYWWEHEANNSTLQPVPPEEWSPVPLMDVTKEGEYELTFHYKRSHPRNHQYNFLDNMGASWGSMPPAHYMEEFHPDFVGEDTVQEMADNIGLDRWEEYYGRVRDDSIVHPEYEHQRPVLRPYIPVERSESTLVLERNPYYPFVDTEGNQLPYIDRIRINLANDSEMAATKAATGEATISARYTQPTDIPLYKRNEEEENYSTNIYYCAYGSAVAIMPNLSHRDSDLREIFQDVNFRKALSLAINRDNINNKVYFGRATPMQTTVIPQNKFYKEEYASAYADYDPEKAKQLLDEMGMVDVNGDGYRETPDGDTFNPTLLYCQTGAIIPTPVLELVDNNWEDIGLNVDMDFVSRELHDTRWNANKGDMTCWTIDYVLDHAFKSPGAARFTPFGTAAFSTPWPGWVNWYNTHGEEGQEPPEEIKELIELSEINALSPDV